jgi:hypothetical protein
MKKDRITQRRRGRREEELNRQGAKDAKRPHEISLEVVFGGLGASTVPNCSPRALRLCVRNLF